MIALDGARAAGLDDDDDSWALQRRLVDELAEHWQEPDNGLWEIRGPQRHFTHSRVMVWVAFDRAVRAVEETAWTGPVDALARRPRRRCARRCSRTASTPTRNTFTQHYDTTEVDASLLVLPLVGFIDGRRPADARHDRGRSSRT